MAAPTTSIDNLKLVVGPLLIGTNLNVFLYGICVVQFARYWENKMNDPTIIKSLVIWTILLDTFHTIALLYMNWVYSVANFANPSFLMIALWPFSSTPVVTALTAFPIQIYLSWRIRQFSKSDHVFTVLSMLSAAQAALGITVSVNAYKNSDLATYSRLIPLVDAWQGMAVITDLSLMVFLWYYLNKNRTGQRSSDNVISRVISNSVETAAVGAFFCIMDLITFTALTNTNIHVIFAFPMGRIYTNILLKTLNSRSSLRAEFEGPMLIPDILLDQSVKLSNGPTAEPNPNRIQDTIGSISVSINVFNADRSRGSSNAAPWQEMQVISTSVIGLKEIDTHTNLDRV